MRILLSDRKGADKKKITRLIEASFKGDHPIHTWDWVVNKEVGENGKLKPKFFLACTLRKAHNVRSKHIERAKGSEQSKLIEFYEYKHNLLHPYVCELPATQADKSPKYNKIAQKKRYEFDNWEGITRYENGLIKRFKAALTLYKGGKSPKAKPPKFKSIKRDKLEWLFTPQSDDLTYCDEGIKLSGSKTLGLIKDQNSNIIKRLKGYGAVDIRSANLSKEPDGWYLSIAISVTDTADYSRIQQRVIGIDMGVVHHATTSAGKHFDLDRDRILHLESRALTLQKAASKQLLHGKNWNRTQQKIKRIRAIIARIKKSWAESFSTKIIKNYDVILVEDLNNNAMRGKAKAKVDDNGEWTKNNASQKTGLNRSLAAAAVGQTIAMIERKAAQRNDKIVIRVNPKHTSQMCSECGYTSPENRQTQDKFECQHCGHHENADINASKNIMHRGIQQLCIMLIQLVLFIRLTETLDISRKGTAILQNSRENRRA